VFCPAEGHTDVVVVRSVQLKDILTRTINAWVNLFDESNKNQMPQLCMELVYEDGRMAFSPRYDQLEELILFVVEQISNTLQAASRYCMLVTATPP